MWTTTFVATFVVLLSPKSQNRFVIVPVEVSLKVTTKGSTPFVGVAVKLATCAEVEGMQHTGSLTETESMYHPLPGLTAPVTVP